MSRNGLRRSWHRGRERVQKRRRQRRSGRFLEFAAASAAPRSRRHRVVVSGARPNPAISRRVVVTGCGCVSAIGTGVGEFWRSLSAGRGGFSRIVPEFADDGVARLVAAVSTFRAEDHFAEGELRLLDRNVQMALVAAREAVAQAGAVFAGARAQGSAVVIGTGIGGMATLEENY